MREEIHTPIDRSLGKATVRMVAVGMAALSLLPPLLWSGAVMMIEQHVLISHTTSSLGRGLELFKWSSVAVVAAASFAIGFGLWLAVFQRPVRALRQAERKLRVFAKRDPLTGLPNRDGLRFAMERSLAQWRGTQRAVGVLVLDVDRFRLVNDSLGPAAGDALLRSVATRIRGVVRESDIVARLGADQFAVQIEGASGVPALSVMARNLLRAFEPAHNIGGRDTVTTLSIGIALQGEHGDSADALLKSAEVAMRAAKAAGGGRSRSFDSTMRVDDDQRLDLERQLRRAQREGEFMLHYQPIMSASGEHIVGAEALLRWADPLRGTVSPAAFIPVLEQTGLIVSVGAWVLRNACRQGSKWIAAGARSLVISVNVSPRQFAEANFVATVKSILIETRFPPTQLQLEVTEGLLLDPMPETLQKIGSLAESGVRLAIDDFGMGYSSLAFLKTFPLSTLKIDRLFVNDSARHARDAAIVRAIIELGHGLGLRVTAEGVETGEQFDVLHKLGCDTFQGYLFSPALPVEQLQDLLEFPGALDNGPNPAPAALDSKSELVSPR